MSRRTILKSAFIVTTAAVASATLFAAGCNGATVNPPPCEDGTANCLSCPAEQPADGSACDEVGMACDYGDPSCSTSDPYRATCGEDNTWTVAVNTLLCNPPPPGPDCPETLPVHGEECETLLDGYDVYTPENCSYSVVGPCGSQVTVSPTCVEDEEQDYRWQVVFEPCNGDPADCGGYDHPDVCAGDTSCRWLVPGCDDGGTSTPFAPGCFAATDCGECGEGLSCETVVYDPCHNSNCGACGAEASVCLPPAE